MKKSRLILFVIAVLIIAGAQVLWHYTAISDFAKGSAIGVGIGLLIVSLLPRIFKKV